MISMKPRSLNDMCFQQEEATCHTTLKTLILLKTKFPSHASFKKVVTEVSRSNSIGLFSTGLLKEEAMVSEVQLLIESYLHESVLENFFLILSNFYILLIKSLPLTIWIFLAAPKRILMQRTLEKYICIQSERSTDIF